MKFFNTAGPIFPDDHYQIPMIERIDLDELMKLIGEKKYFVLHAPRQSGKTSSLLELMKILNESGKYKCLYVNIESAQTARENVEVAIDAIINCLIEHESFYLEEDLIQKSVNKTLDKNPHTLLGNFKSYLQGSYSKRAWIYYPN